MLESFSFGISYDFEDFSSVDIVDLREGLSFFLSTSFSDISYELDLGFKGFSDLRRFGGSGSGIGGGVGGGVGGIDFLLYSYDKFVARSLKSSDYLATSFPLLGGVLCGGGFLLGRGGFVFVFSRFRSDIIERFSCFFGKVYFVGAGAGNKELLSIRGMKHLRVCDIVISDYLLDEAILSSYVSEDAILLPLTKYGSRTQKNLVSQGEINEAILRYSLLLSRVVRLKGGDPFVFGRGGEECEYLLPYNISYELVPGISSMLSALSYSGIPLTHRDYNDGFIAITGYRKGCEEDEDLCNRSIADKVNFGLANKLMVVLFMSLNNWKNFAFLIKDQGAAVALIESGAYNSQRTFVTDVGSVSGLIDELSLRSPTLIGIGENVKVRERLKWFEKLPLYGVRVLIFSSHKLSEEFYEEFSYLAAEVRLCELYELVALESAFSYFNVLDSYDYIVVTSRNAFSFLLFFLKRLSIDIRRLPKVIVTGAKTRDEFIGIGIFPEIVPAVFSSEGVIEELKGVELVGKRFLFPKSSLSSGNISLFLRSSGGIVDEFVLYENRERDLSEEELEGILSFNSDYIVFTSSSSVDIFVKRVYREGMDFRAVAMGNKTAFSLRSYGFSYVLEPKVFTVGGVRDAVLDDFS